MGAMTEPLPQMIAVAASGWVGDQGQEITVSWANQPRAGVDFTAQLPARPTAVTKE